MREFFTTEDKSSGTTITPKDSTYIVNFAFHDFCVTKADGGPLYFI